MNEINTNETLQNNATSNNFKLDVSARPIDPVGNLVGFATVKINDAFVVDNLRICTGANGVFVNMPAMQDKSGEWHDTFFPVTAEAREQLVSAVIYAYGQKLISMQQTVDNTKDVMDKANEKNAEKDAKPSLRQALKDNSEKTHHQPQKPDKTSNEQQR